MQRYLIIILLVLMGLMLVACEDDAELRIRNRTNAPITAKVDDAAEFTIESGSGWSRTYTEDTGVTVKYEGLYVYPTTVERQVTKGLPTTVTVFADCGAVTITNDTTLVITEINISRHDDTGFGENQISGNMTQGSALTWSIKKGSWDFRVITEDGSPLYCMNQTITDDVTLELSISDFVNFAETNKTTGTGSTKSEVILRKAN